ncbi:MAG: hypothetical protein PHE09_14240 [Oscillospiraceae bacterium]|nr:hypothetical protein [Oscillospiraceae bacterium]
MPNWCENDLTITGKKENILNFFEKFRGKPAVYYSPYGYREDDYEKPIFTANSLCPVPDEVLAVGFDGGWREKKIREELIKLKKEPKLNIENYEALKNAGTSSADEAVKIWENINVPDGHQWQTLHWGTRWDPFLNEDLNREISETVFDVTMKEEGDCVICTEIHFLSGWSPPTQFLIEVAPKFPEISFRLVYGEPQMDLSGVIEITGEAILEESEGGYGEYYGE